MPTYLNKQSRADILHSIIKTTFDKREAELKAQHPLLAQRVYEACMPEGFIAATQALPPDWFNRNTNIELRLDGRVFCLPLNLRHRTYDGSTEESNNLSLPGTRTFPASLGRYNTPVLNLDSTAHAQLARDLIQQQAQEQKLADERASLRGQLGQLLASVKTVEKFIEAAPELEPLIPSHVRAATQRGNLPAVIVGNLITDLMAAGLTLPQAA